MARNRSFCTRWIKRKPIARVGALATAAALSTVALLAGCSSGPPLFLSDGRPTTQVDCSGTGSWNSCEQQARARCGGGAFDALGRSIEGQTRTLVFACQAK